LTKYNLTLIKEDKKMLYSLGAFCALAFCGLVYVFVKIGNVVIKWIGLGIITIILIILIATTFTKFTGFVGNLPEIVKEFKDKK
jgi:hypothetical protein